MNLSTRLGELTTAGFVHIVCVACRTGGFEGPAQYTSARARSARTSAKHQASRASCCYCVRLNSEF